MAVAKRKQRGRGRADRVRLIDVDLMGTLVLNKFREAVKAVANTGEAITVYVKGEGELPVNLRHYEAAA